MVCVSSSMPAPVSADVSTLPRSAGWGEGQRGQRGGGCVGFAPYQQRWLFKGQLCNQGILCADRHRAIKHQQRKVGGGKSAAAPLHPQTLDYARQRHHPPNLSWQQGDIKQLPFPDHSMDVVTCQLALHHFSDDDAVLILRELLRVSRRWVFVTDLERSSLGYAGVWLLVHLWLRHPMTRHDALLSVRRSFTAPELRSLAQRAHWPSFQHRSLPWHRQLIYLNKAHHAV
ncbi:MAG: methyltransferase domain-containing protein [Blastochloris sp.]|nr:methyltransferase domain-containing protein [Blastochloris sp.]